MKEAPLPSRLATTSRREKLHSCICRIQGWKHYQSLVVVGRRRSLFYCPCYSSSVGRGEPDVHDEPQRKQGRVMLSMLQAMEITVFHLGTGTGSHECRACRSSGHRSEDECAGCARNQEEFTFQPFSTPGLAKADFELSLEAAIHQVLEELDTRDIVVATTGMASEKCMSTEFARSRASVRFLNWGGMGHAAHITLGLALKSLIGPSIALMETAHS